MGPSELFQSKDKLHPQCDLSMPPYGSTNTFSSVFLFFPESSSGFSSAFRRARLSSVVGFVGLLVRTSSVSSFVMMRSLVGLMVPPPPSFFSQAQLLRVCSLRLYTLQLLHHFSDGLKSVDPGEWQGSRLA